MLCLPITVVTFKLKLGKDFCVGYGWVLHYPNFTDLYFREDCVMMCVFFVFCSLLLSVSAVNKILSIVKLVCALD